MIQKLLFAQICFIFVFIATTMLYAQENDSLPKVQILGSLSLGYASNSDMNDYSKKIGDADAAYYSSLVSGFSNDTSKSFLTYGGDVELRFFTGNFGLGGEIGYHQTQKSSSEVSKSGYVDNTKTTLQLTVIPAVISLFYKIPLETNKSFVLIGAGAGYYLGSMNFKYEENDSLSSTNNSFDVDDTQSTIGYHAMLEYDYIIDSGITFFTGIKVRYVEFDSFKNTNTYAVSITKTNEVEAGLTGISWYIGAGMSF